MSFDLILRDARLDGRPEPTDIGIRDGRIAAVAPALPADGPVEDLGGRLAVPGFVETHVHLDKSCLLGRCTCREGTLDEAVAAVAQAKRSFTEEDVYARAERTLRKAIGQGTMRMRTHVEVDPRIGLTSLRALTRLKRDYAWAVGIEICVFPQEGLLDDPGCEDVLVAALEGGADVVGGAPYMDADSHGQIARIFALAKRYDVDIDFHLDFGLDPAHLDVEEVCRLTDATGWGGRVAVGHVTKFSSVSPERFGEIAGRLAASGVAVTVLPATDLFLTGRDHDRDVPRGVTPAHRFLALGVNCSLSTNNVLNPFTPFGDCSLVRMANLYANIAQVGTPAGMTDCLAMVTTRSARLLNLDDYGIVPGNPADVVVLDCETPADAVAELAQPLFGLKGGTRTFTRPAPRLHDPR
ncbi:Cytosine deaminase [Methylobacterium crusticola]|uniref:Cytosine deaminase n=1 Tax=Methylobacterium crusticola TaxID=1697972 RepID=A0ABQ4QX99_9HYPH|nr:amidohydrolase family protein [Methylobacterium crusticola]GJD49266.1 Cytosine deaminase [Methylobacterium crusticola]